MPLNPPFHLALAAAAVASRTSTTTVSVKAPRSPLPVRAPHPSTRPRALRMPANLVRTTVVVVEPTTSDTNPTAVADRTHKVILVEGSSLMRKIWNFIPECEISRRRLKSMNAIGIFTSKAVSTLRTIGMDGLEIIFGVCAGTADKTRRSVCSWCNVFFLSSRGLISQSILISSATCLYYHSYGVDFNGACRFIRKGFTTATIILHRFPMENFIGSQRGASMH